MNRRMIGYIIGKMMGVEALVLLLPALISLIYREDDYVFFLMTSVVLAVIYFLLARKKPAESTEKKGWLLLR